MNMHGAHNTSVAVMVASSAFSDRPNVILMIATMVVMMLMILILLSSVLKIKPAPAEKSN